MTIQEILDYIAKTPENANVNVLSGMLDELTSDGGGEGGGDITVEALSVTENGTYTAEEGKAYSPVTVNVPSDFSSATVTITDSRATGSGIIFSYATYAEAGNSFPACSGAAEYLSEAGASPASIPVILYKGAAVLSFEVSQAEACTITGAEYEWVEDSLIIKGSCAIEFGAK